MIAHTPGPWIVYDDSNDGKTNRIEIVATGKTIARIYHSVPQEDMPNARLIAAAPELLEAAQAMLAVCYDLERNDETLAAVKKTMKAVFKATGENNG